MEEEDEATGCAGTAPGLEDRRRRRKMARGGLPGGVAPRGGGGGSGARGGRSVGSWAERAGGSPRPGGLTTLLFFGSSLRRGIDPAPGPPILAWQTDRGFRQRCDQSVGKGGRCVLL